MYNHVVKHAEGVINNMRVAICDDDVTTLNNLRNIILREFQINNFLYEKVDVFDSGRKFLDAYKNIHMMWLFLI